MGEVTPNTHVIPAGTLSGLDLTGTDLVQRQTMLSPADGVAQDPPQWVVMGLMLRGRCAILASSTLTRAEMRRRVEDYEVQRRHGRPLRLRKDTAAVGFVCDGFTMIYGATYAECWASLAAVWQPPAELEGGG